MSLTDTDAVWLFPYTFHPWGLSIETFTFFLKLPQAKPAVKKHKPIQKCLGNLFHNEIDHWSIGPQDEEACQPLRKLDQEVITRVNKFVLQCVNYQLFRSLKKRKGYLLHHQDLLFFIKWYEK